MRISLVHKSTHLIASTSVVFCMVSIGVYVFFFQQIEQHKVQLEEVRTTYAGIEQNRDALNALVNRLTDTKDARESLRARILTNDGVIDFLTLVESLGREQQVQLKTETLTVVPLDSVFETLDVRVSVEGEYDRLVSMLTLFEHLPYQVAITDVQFTSTEGASLWRSTYDIRVTKFK